LIQELFLAKISSAPKVGDSLTSLQRERGNELDQELL
jgi:hypothetical protein